MRELTFESVVELVRKEREHQDRKFGTIEKRHQSIPGFILIAGAELKEAEEGWMKDRPGRHSSLSELVQVAATAIACIETHGFGHNGESNRISL